MTDVPIDNVPIDDVPDGATEYPSGYPKRFWVALVIGWAIVAVGIRGLLMNSDSAMPTNPPGWVLLLVKSNLVHDLVLVPVVLLVGVVVARLVPGRVRAPIEGGLICTGVVVLFAFPFVRGYGVRAANPTILPQNHARGLLLTLAVVWTVTALVTVRHSRRRGAS